MNGDVLLFFDGKPGALALYEAFEERLLAELGPADIRVQKTQISFYSRHMFACVSLIPVRPAKLRPQSYIVVTFGLGYKKGSPRIDVASEPCPNRWTHHVLISGPEEIDGELIGWIREAREFSEGK